MTRDTKLRLIWIIAGGLMVLTRIIVGQQPQIIEQWYSRGIFPLIRIAIDYTIAMLPFPLILLFIAYIIYRLKTGLGYLLDKTISLRDRVQGSILRLLSFSSGLIFFFLLLWGFNYARVPVEDQLNLQLQALTYEELIDQLEKEVSYLDSYRHTISESPEALSAVHLPDDLEKKMRALVEQTMESLGYPTVGRVQARMLQPKGVILRISTSGFYFPWTGESHLDAGLHPIQLPSVLAHELAHGYGITDEGSCNFIAYLACLNSSDPFLQYAGHFGYWKYLRSSLYRQNNEAYQEHMESLTPGVKNDLKAVRKEMDLYPDILPKIRNLTYDTYLKTQGISDGIANYSRIILLVHAWEKKGTNL